MPGQVFVDTTAWLALVSDRDAWHADAVETYRALLNSRTALLTTVLVLAEAHILIRRRVSDYAAASFLRNLNDSSHIEIVYPDARLEAQARHILARYHDHSFSLTDALSFALMRERGMVQAFTFDKHFITAGFTWLSE